MSESARRNITISGAGSIAAGTYEIVTVNGGGTLDGQVICTSLRINGMGTCKGAVKAADLAVNGTATFEGPVQATEMVVNGDASVRAGLGVGRLVVRGNLTVDGGVAARDVDLKGVLRVGGDVTADTIRGEGSFSAADVHADLFDLAVYSSSKVQSLDAGRVTLRAPASFADVLMFFTDKQFNATTIRGSEVWLEHTVANVVSAGNATVGRDSRIGLVQHSGAFSLVDNAQVGEVRKVEPSA
jgi:cytoskeletal protein CcmA (bactofilin family)